MFTTRKTVVTTTGKFSSKLSERVDDLLGKGMETLDAGMKVMDEAFREAETDATEAVSTTIRIRLTSQQVSDLQAGRTLTFKTDSTTILLEKAE
jgi:polyhydroxyalkanoate synthesis regulator phasin